MPILIAFAAYFIVVGFILWLNYKHHSKKHIEDLPDVDAFMGRVRVIKVDENSYV